AYVTQDDILMATLTVWEVDFYSAQLQLPGSMSTADKRERVVNTIKQMGLDDSVNTRIGGWRMEGLSGGQKRRVSIAIEIRTRPQLLFLDEPTSGLDRIATLARDDKRTIITSIHQPSGEVFELFDDLCLLAGGRTIYFGEASQANEIVFGRKRFNGHYGVMTFVIANTVSSIPYLMLIAAFPGGIAYFLVNLHSGFDHFMFFVLVLFACMMLVESLMMMVASIVPDFLLGIITGAGIQVEMGYSKWVDLLILGGMVMVYRVLFFTIIKLREKLRPLLREELSSFHPGPIKTSPPVTNLNI
ncbi:hypothetical protein KI387_000023, partial [Taxus chinensis]